VLLGRPGAGKSSTLRRLVTGLDDTKVPIFADLSEWYDPSQGLLTFLQEQLRSLEQHALAVVEIGLMVKYVRRGADPFEEPPRPSLRGPAYDDAPLTFAY